MATTTPHMSDTSICITRAGRLLTRSTSLTAQQPATVPPSATPAHWKPLPMDPTSCGCGRTDVP